MSIQWTLAAGFLYAEMAFLFLLCLPIISSARWVYKLSELKYFSTSFYGLCAVSFDLDGAKFLTRTFFQRASPIVVSILMFFSLHC
jgi:hypothetical protein